MDTPTAATDPNAWAGVLNAMNNLDARVQWLIFAAFITWIVFWRGFSWWDNRCARIEKTKEDAAKRRADADEVARQDAVRMAAQEQSEALNENIQRLCAVMEQHTSEEEANSSRMNHDLVRFTDTVAKLARDVRGACEKMSGLMSRGDSITAIDDKMTGSVRADVCAIFDRSMRENDFANRGAFIKSKVKTAIGDVITAAKLKLETSYHLSVDLDPFFPQRESDQGGNRFVLCDELWYWVEPLYKSHSAIDSRLEEMRVNVGNVIANQMANAKAAAVEAARREIAASI